MPSAKYGFPQGGLVWYSNTCGRCATVVSKTATWRPSLGNTSITLAMRQAASPTTALPGSNNTSNP